MSLESVKKYFKTVGMDDRIILFDHESSTVAMAAKELNCEEDLIAKTLSFLIDDKAILIVTSGDAKIDNAKYKHYFGKKAKMIPFEDVERLTGHEVGGVCPFAPNDGVKVYLDNSLKKYDYVYPACGSKNSAIKISIEELEKYSNYVEWIDVCKEAAKEE